MRNLRAICYELKCRLFDWSFSPVAGWCLACGLFLGFLVLQRVRPAQALRLVQRAHYLLFRTGHFDATGSPLNLRVEQALRRCLAGPPGPGGLPDESPPDAVRQDFVTAPGGLVLKAPRTTGGSVVEKGVLLVKNTRQIRAFRNLADVAAILRDYVLVLEPSWSGYAQADILYFTRFAAQPIIVMATAEQDYRFLERLRTNLVPAAFGASDWVNPSVFRPLDGQDKPYDAVMVARWSLVKRHHVLFRALRRLGDPSFRVALLAPNWVGDVDRASIESLMDLYGVARQLTIFEDLAPAQVNAVLNQSKVNLLLSRQEGSNRSLFEGFFAGTPGLAFKHNVGLPLSYLNDQTGWLIDEEELATALLYFRDHWRNFEPRAWAQSHITPELTVGKLGALLRALAQRRGEPWTRDLVAKFNGPGLRYYPAASAGTGLPTMAELLERYPRRGD